MFLLGLFLRKVQNRNLYEFIFCLKFINLVSQGSRSNKRVKDLFSKRITVLKKLKGFKEMSKKELLMGLQVMFTKEHINIPKRN